MNDIRPILADLGRAAVAGVVVAVPIYVADGGDRLLVGTFVGAVAAYLAGKWNIAVPKAPPAA